MLTRSIFRIENEEIKLTGLGRFFLYLLAILVGSLIFGNVYLFMRTQSIQMEISRNIHQRLGHIEMKISRNERNIISSFSSLDSKENK